MFSLHQSSTVVVAWELKKEKKVLKINFQQTLDKVLIMYYHCTFVHTTTIMIDFSEIAPGATLKSILQERTLYIFISFNKEEKSVTVIPFRYNDRHCNRQYTTWRLHYFKLADSDQQLMERIANAWLHFDIVRYLQYLIKRNENPDTVIRGAHQAQENKVTQRARCWISKKKNRAKARVHPKS